MTRWRPDQPYNELPLLPPAVEVETRAVLKRCITARAAVARLEQAVELIPNPDILIGTLPVLEAQASSEIENVVTTTERLFQQLHAEARADPATKEALRYRKALLEGMATLAERPLSTRTAESICSRILGVEMTVRKVPGTVVAQVATGEPVYTPPVGESLLRDLLADWERFLHRADELDPLVRLAIGHYQFEAIHPFTDGNGRTGRVLNSLLLVAYGLLPQPVLYLSRFLLVQRADYYRLLREVTAEEAWQPWLLFMLRGIEETADWTTAKIGAIRRLGDATADYVRRRLPKIYSRELVDCIVEHPYCRIAHLVGKDIVGRQAASRYLKQLADIGILREHRVGREKLFEHTKLLRLLESDESDFPAYPVN